MKKLLILVLVFVIAQTGITFSQQNTQLKTAKDFPVLKPTFIVSDIYIAMQILDGIELNGNEVDAFLEVKNTMKSFLETAQNNKLKANDNIKVDLPGHIAQNALTFLSRSVLKGSMAEQYKRFVEAIIESSKTEKK
ncbi:MAG: hypothetical protein V1779_02695 [bacterium]